MAVAAVGLYYKPDTRYVCNIDVPQICRPMLLSSSIQTWALREAKARMEARGESTEYKPSSSN